MKPWDSSTDSLWAPMLDQWLAPMSDPMSDPLTDFVWVQQKDSLKATMSVLESAVEMVPVSDP